MFIHVQHSEIGRSFMKLIRSLLPHIITRKQPWLWVRAPTKAIGDVMKSIQS